MRLDECGLQIDDQPKVIREIDGEEIRRNHLAHVLVSGSRRSTYRQVGVHQAVTHSTVDVDQRVGLGERSQQAEVRIMSEAGLTQRLPRRARDLHGRRERSFVVNARRIRAQRVDQCSIVPVDRLQQSQVAVQLTAHVFQRRSHSLGIFFARLPLGHGKREQHAEHDRADLDANPAQRTTSEQRSATRLGLG
jgi:hypothetical protein